MFWVTRLFPPFYRQAVIAPYLTWLC
jgi:hypothetical protein